jgi:hypothetical protein
MLQPVPFANLYIQTFLIRRSQSKAGTQEPRWPNVQITLLSSRC